MPTSAGEFMAYGYESLLDGEQHLALVKGDVAGDEDVLVRVHSECLTGRRVPLPALRLRSATAVCARQHRA